MVMCNRIKLCYSAYFVCTSLRPKHDQTPLHYAAFGGFSKFPTYNKVIEFLLQYEADPNRHGEVREGVLMRGVCVINVSMHVYRNNGIS